MAEEFIINSSAIEAKVNQLLPSQGGFGAGVDFSASTMVIPIVDLTETAEGGTTRADLQRSFSLVSNTSQNTFYTTNTIVNTTGYFTLFVSVFTQSASVGTIDLTDGTTTKTLYRLTSDGNFQHIDNFNLDVFLKAGDSVTATTNSTNCEIHITSRQIADLAGNLVNPL